MIKQYNEFMCAHCGEDINLEIGQSYFVDGQRMRLSSISKDRYIFIKGDHIVTVPEDKLDRYVSERKKHILRFYEKVI